MGRRQRQLLRRSAGVGDARLGARLASSADDPRRHRPGRLRGRRRRYAGYDERRGPGLRRSRLDRWAAPGRAVRRAEGRPSGGPGAPATSRGRDGRLSGHALLPAPGPRVSPAPAVARGLRRSGVRRPGAVAGQRVAGLLAATAARSSAGTSSDCTWRRRPLWHPRCSPGHARTSAAATIDWRDQLQRRAASLAVPPLEGGSPAPRRWTTSSIPASSARSSGCRRWRPHGRERLQDVAQRRMRREWGRVRRKVTGRQFPLRTSPADFLRRYLVLRRFLEVSGPDSLLTRLDSADRTE